jgi:hypothetical protein
MDDEALLRSLHDVACEEEQAEKHQRALQQLTRAEGELDKVRPELTSAQAKLEDQRVEIHRLREQNAALTATLEKFREAARQLANKRKAAVVSKQPAPVAKKKKTRPDPEPPSSSSDSEPSVDEVAPSSFQSSSVSSSSDSESGSEEAAPMSFQRSTAKVPGLSTPAATFGAQAPPQPIKGQVSFVNRIVQPTHDTTGFERYIWDSIIAAFSLSQGGFVTEQNIIDAGGESVFGSGRKPLLDHDRLHTFFTTPVAAADEKSMRTKQRMNGTRQEWIVMLPEWLQSLDVIPNALRGSASRQ